MVVGVVLDHFAVLTVDVDVGHVVDVAGVGDLSHLVVELTSLGTVVAC